MQGLLIHVLRRAFVGLIQNPAKGSSGLRGYLVVQDRDPTLQYLLVHTGHYSYMRVNFVESLSDLNLRSIYRKWNAVSIESGMDLRLLL